MALRRLATVGSLCLLGLATAEPGFRLERRQYESDLPQGNDCKDPTKLKTTVYVPDTKMNWGNAYPWDVVDQLDSKANKGPCADKACDGNSTEQAVKLNQVKPGDPSAAEGLYFQYDLMKTTLDHSGEGGNSTHVPGKPPPPGEQGKIQSAIWSDIQVAFLAGPTDFGSYKRLAMSVMEQINNQTKDDIKNINLSEIYIYVDQDQVNCGYLSLVFQVANGTDADFPPPDKETCPTWIDKINGLNKTMDDPKTPKDVSDALKEFGQIKGDCDNYGYGDFNTDSSGNSTDSSSNSTDSSSNSTNSSSNSTNSSSNSTDPLSNGSSTKRLLRERDIELDEEDAL